jgi:hypothetical protein
MQRFAINIAHLLNRESDVSMIAYLDDWLIYGEDLLMLATFHRLQQLRITINTKKSVTPATGNYQSSHQHLLTYLGLNINLFRRTMQATPACLSHLQDLLSLVPQASQQDLLCIMSWLAWALGWPQFLAQNICQHGTYWLRVLLEHHVLQAARPLHPPR